jgi:hypothetical protein
MTTRRPGQPQDATKGRPLQIFPVARPAQGKSSGPGAVARLAPRAWQGGHGRPCGTSRRPLVTPGPLRASPERQGRADHATGGLGERWAELGMISPEPVAGVPRGSSGSAAACRAGLPGRELLAPAASRGRGLSSPPAEPEQGRQSEAREPTGWMIGKLAATGQREPSRRVGPAKHGLVPRAHGSGAPWPCMPIRAGHPAGDFSGTVVPEGPDRIEHPHDPRDDRDARRVLAMGLNQGAAT